MKGLLKKEFIMIWKNFRYYMVMCLFFLGFGIWSDNNFFMLFYPAMLGGMMPMSLLSFDEKSGWDLYSLCFPLSRAQLVSCKYLISLICSGAVCAVYALAWAIKVWVTGVGMTTLAIYLYTLLTVALLPPALLLPCIFKFGSQKGAWFYYIFLAAVFAAVIAVLNVFPYTDFTVFPVFVLPLAAALLFALSWPLSARIYAKKDF